tara:strand:+ start:1336 stop:1848 length:513 start_codon:yes stop_codon:yes gene_type:complete
MKQELIYEFMENERLKAYNIHEPNGKVIIEYEYGYVYVIHNKDNGLIKIGKTKDLHQRFNALKSGSGCDLELIYSICTDSAYGESTNWVEKSLHTFFDSKRIRGEWFKLSLFDIYRLCLLFEEQFECHDNAWENNPEHTRKFRERQDRLEQRNQLDEYGRLKLKLKVGLI